ncbi:MAG: hypothetical protein KDK70_19215 [Myxococcales bacterium]|nr:hypothetical protein [Myxococcales bacterium]
MTILRLASGCSVLLALAAGLAACQAADPTAEGESLAALSSRLDATEQRLAAIEAKLDAMSTTLDQTAASLAPVAEWTAARKTRDDEREARRLEREARRLERDSLRPWGTQARDTELDTELDTVPRPGDRTIEGADEALHCQGFDTDRIECEVDRAFIDELLASPERLAKQARIVPSMRDGVPRGYKFYGIRSGSLPKLLGVKNGDLLLSVNGEALDSIDGAMKLYTRLRGTTRLELGLERKGRPLTLVLELVA